uniref:Uncharacterized protein n=1 Tax=Candidatus Kentrum sp. SD TaxID=2126332 RepID=A0A451BM38_9GAMM|nr:MAG: hypothetical protein BECKSD772D_GA0070982_10457 [Candidatus Kentron sp. SD]
MVDGKPHRVTRCVRNDKTLVIPKRSEGSYAFGVPTRHKNFIRRWEVFSSSNARPRDWIRRQRRRKALHPVSAEPPESCSPLSVTLYKAPRSSASSALQSRLIRNCLVRQDAEILIGLFHSLVLRHEYAHQCLGGIDPIIGRCRPRPAEFTHGARDTRRAHIHHGP